MARDFARDDDAAGVGTHSASQTGAPSAPPLGWFGILRIGLIQTAIGAIVLLTTSTLNRVMVVELGLLAIVPGLLVGWHYAIQMLRPRWGYGSDVGGRRTPWVIGGMAVLASGGILAALATALTTVSMAGGMVLAVVAFTLIGIGVGAAGTNLLTLLATRVDPRRRAAAASTVWIMMIAGFVVTAISVGQALDPFTMTRLVVVVATVGVIAFLVTCVAIAGLEGSAQQGAHRSATAAASQSGPAKPGFFATLEDVWREPQARRFTVFVFVSMLAYSMQDLILEPYAGIVFAMTPGESTKLSGVHHGGVLAGMLLVAVLGSFRGGSRVAVLRAWSVGGCLASAVALAVLAYGGAYGGADWPLRPSVFALGFANGAFAVGAIGSMMGLAGAGRSRTEGTRMGLWGAAQAIAFGLGGFIGAGFVDVSRAMIADPAIAYAGVFLIEGLLFAFAALIALRVGTTDADQRKVAQPLAGEALMELEGR